MEYIYIFRNLPKEFQKIQRYLIGNLDGKMEMNL